MPIFDVFGQDIRPVDPNRRAAHKPEHADYIMRDVSALRLAGALVEDDGTQCGSLYLVEAESADEVRAWLGAEPFVREGVYESLVVRRITLNPPWSVPDAQPADALRKIITP
jgi:uncharacterized protein YciI